VSLKIFRYLKIFLDIL